MTDPVRSFYRHHPPDLTPITDLTHRHFRILLPRGTFLKIPDRITSPAILQHWLARYRPTDVYYSTSCWLSPENLGRREGTPLSDNIFLSSDIVFDIDRSPFTFENLDDARMDTLRLVEFCRNEGLPVRYIAFSGSKGFHLVCTDTVRYDTPDPRAREDLAKNRRRAILSRVQAAGIAVDPRITPDTRRIIRVPGTINSRTGHICTVLTQDQLLQPIREILKYVPKVTLGTPQIPATGDDSSLRGTRIISWLCHRLGVRSKPISPVSYATFLVNSVPGIERQIPIFMYPPRRNLQKVETELRLLQQQYGLSDIYLYRSETEITAICLRTFSEDRLRKILKASTATNFATLLKYHQLFFRIGEKCSGDGQVRAGAPVYCRTIAATDADNAHFVSRPHHQFLSDFIPLRDYPRMHGNGTVFLTHTVIEDE
jgi:DNA primase catalytic subunit